MTHLLGTGYRKVTEVVTGNSFAMIMPLSPLPFCFDLTISSPALRCAVLGLRCSEVSGFLEYITPLFHSSFLPDTLGGQMQIYTQERLVDVIDATQRHCAFFHMAMRHLLQGAPEVFGNRSARQRTFRAYPVRPPARLPARPPARPRARGPLHRAGASGILSQTASRQGRSWAWRSAAACTSASPGSATDWGSRVSTEVTSGPGALSTCPLAFSCNSRVWDLGCPQGATQGGKHEGHLCARPRQGEVMILRDFVGGMAAAVRSSARGKQGLGRPLGQSLSAKVALRRNPAESSFRRPCAPKIPSASLRIVSEAPLQRWLLSQDLSLDLCIRTPVAVAAGRILETLSRDMHTHTLAKTVCRTLFRPNGCRIK